MGGGKERKAGGEGDPTLTVTKPSFTTICLETLRNAPAAVTLEPMLFLKMAAEGNFMVVADTLEIDRVCRVNLNFSNAECQAMDDGNHTEVQVAVQKYQNVFNYYQGLMNSLIPLLVVVFAGSLSDHHGRKPPMLAVLGGFVCLALVYLLMAINPHWPVEVLLLATFSVCVTGTWVVFNMAVYSYVADITTPECRTKRLGILDAVWYLGGPLGQLIGGWLYKFAGYSAVFGLSGVLWLLCFLYVLFLVQESVDVKNLPPPTPQEVKEARFGPLRHVVALLRTAFKRRPGRGRQFLLGLLSIKLLVFLVQGHQTYLWARRVLGWTASEFLTWSSLESLSHQAGMVAWVSVASKQRLHDTLVAAVGLVSMGSWSVVLAFVTNSSLWWLVIVASAVGLFEATIEPALRTLLTVVAGEAEVGRILALNGLLESAWFTVDRSLYTYLYNTFVKDFPQINFVVQAAISLVLVLTMVMLWWRMRDSQITLAVTPPIHTLSGHAHHDIISGHAHHDIISGHAHHDIISGHAHHDIISGHAHHDIISGHAHHDIISGHAHHDIISSHDHHDSRQPTYPTSAT